MALRTTSEPRIKRIPFMEDLDVKHVSIVDYGANWTPFQLIQQKVQKNDQGDAMPGQFIQAILTPESKELEDLAADPRYAWLRDVVVNVKRDYGNLRKHQCAKRDAFDSLSLAPIGDSGAYALVGESKSGDGVDLLALKKAPADLIAAMQVPQEEIIARLIDDEMYRFQSIMWSTLHQEAQVPAKRKAIIMNALSGLWDFMNSILDAMGPAAVKMQKRDGQEQVIQKQNEEDANMDATEIQAIVAKAFDEKSSELMAKVESMKSGKEPEKPAPFSEVVKAVTDLAGIVTELKSDFKAISDKMAVVEKKTEEPAATVTDQKGDAMSDVVAAMKSQIDALSAQIASFNHSSQTVPPAADVAASASKSQVDPGEWSLDMFKRRDA